MRVPCTIRPAAPGPARRGSRDRRWAPTRALEAFGKAEWLVVDHYALEGRFEDAVRPVTHRVMVVDDLADRQHQCDLLLDQNDSPDSEHRYDLLVPRTCDRLLGPAYALLRSEFASERANLPQRVGNVQRILIFFGGGDPGNETKKAINAFWPFRESISISMSSLAEPILIGWRSSVYAPHIQTCIISARSPTSPN